RRVLFRSVIFIVKKHIHFKYITLFEVFGVQFIPKIVKCRNHILRFLWERKDIGFILFFVVYGCFFCGMVEIYLDIFGITSFINFSYKTVWDILFLVNIRLIIISYLEKQI